MNQIKNYTHTFFGDSQILHHLDSTTDFVSDIVWHQLCAWNGAAVSATGTAGTAGGASEQNLWQALGEVSSIEGKVKQ